MPTPSPGTNFFGNLDTFDMTSRPFRTAILERLRVAAQW